MSKRILKLATSVDAELSAQPATNGELTRAAIEIVEEVRERGEQALREYAERLGDVEQGAPMVLGRAALDAARDALPFDQRKLLERTAARIRSFATAQRNSLDDLRLDIGGGTAGHTARPVRAAGCYAPGGRFPLPSSVLMTAVTARAAGVPSVWVASPHPAAVTLAAASIAGADGFLAVGGAQAIAALAFGTVMPRMDLIAGPGNRWVTAAKRYLYGEVGIDLLAGPSELTVVADSTADARRIAADLIAVAEHDVDALPVLVTTEAALIEAVERELGEALANLPTGDTARSAFERGFALLVADLAEAASAVDKLAPEHLSLDLADPAAFAARVQNYGALFLGSHSPEVLGDYGAGPNHVLPTSTSARFSAGLNVFTFLRVQTWLDMADSAEARALASDAAALARLEGLEGHGRSADLRK